MTRTREENAFDLMREELDAQEAKYRDEQEQKTNLSQVAESAGYELAEDYLSDAAHDIRSKLSEAGVNTFNISQDDIVALLRDEDGDVDRVLAGYLD